MHYNNKTLTKHTCISITNTKKIKIPKNLFILILQTKANRKYFVFGL